MSRALEDSTADERSRSASEHVLGADVLGLVVIGCPSEPWRIGEVAIVPPGRQVRVFGRGNAVPNDGCPRIALARQRPDSLEITAPVMISSLSRRQILVRSDGAAIEVERVGRAPVFHEAREIERTRLAPGDTLQIGRQLLFLCVQRPAWLSENGVASLVPFGEPDQHGIVGESREIWNVRRWITFVAPQAGHALILGPSGTGKELAARALHRASGRADRPFVSRNAAAMPDSLFASELFGTAKNYPNAGMPERPGLLGQIDGGVLFLDEFGELAAGLQAQLLRVLDSGEYQRLGETGNRCAELRFIAASNRSEAALKHDIAGRLTFRVELPGLDARREDIPLLARSLLRRVAAEQPATVRRYFTETPQGPEARISLELTRAWMRHAFTTHVRELERTLWDAIRESTRDVLDPPRYLRETNAPISRAPLQHSFAPAQDDGWSSRDNDAEVDPDALPAGEIQACLDHHNGVLERTWRALGLKSRYVLTRLIEKHGLEVRRRPSYGPRRD